MKKITAIIFAAILLATATQAQERKPDSLVLQVTMDTTTWKFVTQLIREQVPTQSASGQLILSQILGPLYNYRVVVNPALPPKEEPKKEAPKKPKE